MRILSVTAQRPDSTGSGVCLTELVRGFDRLGQMQAVLCGLGSEDGAAFPEGVGCFPVRYETDRLPYPVLGISFKPYILLPLFLRLKECCLIRMNSLLVVIVRKQQGF